LINKNNSEIKGIGVNAVAQTGTEILGAANRRLKAFNAVVDNANMMVMGVYEAGADKI